MSEIKEVQQPAAPGSLLGEMAEACGGQATVHSLLDERGVEVHSFGTMSFPLRKDHWIYQKDETPAGFKSNVPPMPFRMGSREWMRFHIKENLTSERVIASIDRDQFAHAIRAAGKYAVRCSTMNGSEMDFDPDAMLQNLVVGFLGYWTETGFTGDPEDGKWCDPQTPFDFTPPPPRNMPGQAQATGDGPPTAPGCSAMPEA